MTTTTTEDRPPKTCSACGETKPADDFYPRKGQCKACYLAMRSSDEYKERRNRKARERYAADAELRKQESERTKEWQAANPFKALVPGYKHRAAKKGVPFDLDKEYLESIWTGTCPAFGTRLDLPHSKKHPRGAQHINQPSLDRIFPDRGYVKGNVIWISAKANVIKNNASAADILRVGQWLQQTEEEIERHEQAR